MRIFFIARGVLFISFIIFFVLLIKLFVIDHVENATKLPSYDFENFNNETGCGKAIIPDIIHYVIFEKREIDFIFFLSIVSVMKVHRPKQIWIHSDSTNISGRYWSYIVELSELLEVNVMVRWYPRPTHVFGQPLSSIYHASDASRIQILMSFGGVYLDTDTILLKSLSSFLKFEMVIGWPDNDYIGTQILLAHKDARLLKLWLEGYRYYKPREWYFNAGHFPTGVVSNRGHHLVHRVKEHFGVHNLLQKLHANSTSAWDWKSYYSIHLLSRHSPTPSNLNEISIKDLKSPFGSIARYLLYECGASFEISSDAPHWIFHTTEMSLIKD